jgi:predicted secreted protein
MEQASATLFPLDLLLEALRLQGMPVAADLQLRLAHYLNRQGGRVLSAEQWKHRLSALLSHDAEQQAQLQRLFDQLWEGWQAATAAGEAP